MSKILVMAALAAGGIPAVLHPTGRSIPADPVMQIQMPSQTIQGQTRTPPGKAWPNGKATAAKKSAGKLAPAPQGTTSAEDKKIEDAIHAKLAKSKIGKDGFTVRVQGGVAFWEGSTSVVQHKGSATRMAKSAGAKTVVNNIKVTDAAKEKAAENLDAGRRRAQVKRSEPRVQQ